MRRTPIPWIAACLAAIAALALAACGSSQTISTSRPAPATPANGQSANATSKLPCVDLQLSYAGTEGATGHMEVTFTARNLSQQTCRLRGYPAARLLDGAGRTLSLHVRRGHGFFPDTMPAPRSVVLKPGAKARFGLSFVTNNEYAGARTCHTAATAITALPGGSSSRWTRVSLRAAPKLSPCGRQLVVSPIYE